MPKRITSRIQSRQKIYFVAIIFAIGFSSIALLLHITNPGSLASTPYVAVEAESGSVTSPAAVQTNSAASGGKDVQFVQTTPPPPPPAACPGTWNTVKFDDEFNGSSIDTTHWAKSWFNGGSMNNVKTDPANQSVSGGDLILTLKSSSDGALVDTDPTQVSPGFQFGTGVCIGASVYFPGSGKTIYNWPAWWTDGQSWPKDGEIDIAEGLGDLTSNYHSPKGADNSGTIPGTWSNGWHTYAVDRESGQNTVYWDGAKIRTYSTDDGGAQQYLIFNVGQGEGPTVTGTGSQVKVDWVKVWGH